jgi:hypothetical protein
VEYSNINQELNKLTSVKIAQLASLLNLHGYEGEVHINGIEQGSLWQVINSCLDLRRKNENHPFKDPVELSHFSYNADESRYLISRFSIELDHPNRFRITAINYENFDAQHNFIKSKKVRIKGLLDIPKREKARRWVTPKSEKEERKRSLGL